MKALQALLGLGVIIAGGILAEERIHLRAQAIEWVAASMQQHGPDAKCSRICAPAGHEDHANPPDELPVVTCGADTGDGCATEKGGECQNEHRLRCAENCRRQCCRCCSWI